MGMEVSVILPVIFIYFLRSTTQAYVLSSSNPSFYTAGVVEFRPNSAKFEHASLQDQLDENLNGYTEIILSKEAAETDIIVFPEMTLNSNEAATFVPNPLLLTSPCDKTTNEDGEKYHYFLIHFSCLAEKVAKYIVINVCEKAYCENSITDPRPCADTGLNIFNTNVVFDRKGRVISRYRKIHLWGEPRNTTFIPSFKFFDTDFGVRFGQFICFDLLFYSPAQEMVDKLGIRDFVFPTMWFSQLPFLTAVQMQSAWSYANDVNLLAAGASSPNKGTTGTGIYNGRNGALQAVMSQGEGQRRLFVAKLPKRTNYTQPNQLVTRNKDLNINKLRVQMKENYKGVFLKHDELEHYETEVISLMDTKSYQKQLCQHNETANTYFCCHFDLQWNHKYENRQIVAESLGDRYYYRLGVYNGLRKEKAPDSNELRNCALFACIGPDIADCGKRLEYEPSTRITFERLIIEATFPKASKFLLMPNSLKEDLLPIDVSDFDWDEAIQLHSHKVRYALRTPASNLLTFSIYGNYFDSIVSDKIILCDSGVESSAKVCDERRSNNTASLLVFPLNLKLIFVISVPFLF